MAGTVAGGKGLLAEMKEALRMVAGLLAKMLTLCTRATLTRIVAASEVFAFEL